jgi:hypothetical protein
VDGPFAVQNGHDLSVDRDLGNYRQAELVAFARAGGILLLGAFQSAWPHRFVGACEPPHLGLVQQLDEPGGVLAGNRPQQHGVAGKRGFCCE